VGRRTYQRDPFRDGPTTAVTVVEQGAVDLRYDYQTIAEAQRDIVRRAALAIKPRLKRAAEDIFVIGKELRATKALLAHGEYTNWLDVEFGLSDRMAQRFVNVYERLGAKSDIMSVLPPTTLYLLAAPSTPEQAITSVEKQLGAGVRIGVATVQRVIADAKQQARSAVLADVLIDSADGEVLPTPSGEQKQAAQRVEQVLATLVDLLNDQAVADWSLLFASDDLRSMRAQIMRLQRTLHETVTDSSEASRTVRQ
jgi:hypothetical protein